MNECLASPCSQECANIYGSYQCYCRKGYYLRQDGHTCEGWECTVAYHKYHICTKIEFAQVHESVYTIYVLLVTPDIDECSQSIGHLCMYKCVNVPGSYQCACPEYGYTMSPNGRSCRGESLILKTKTTICMHLHVYC